MSNGWTGGQYSVVRAGAGVVLAVCFLRAALASSAGGAPPLRWWPDLLAAPMSPGLRIAAGAAGAILALLFALGWHDRVAVVLASGLWLFLVAHRVAPGAPTPGALVVLAAFHLALPPAPYGSWAARGRPDPGGGWRFPAGLRALAWLLLIAAYGMMATHGLSSRSWRDGSAYVLFVAPVVLLLLCLSRPTRPWGWAGLLAIQLVVLIAIGTLGTASLMIVLHVLTFDPGWIRPLRESETDAVFYDGHCGLCHRSVRFLLAEDRSGSSFRYAPLDAPVFRAQVSEERRKDLPDSIVLVRPDGILLTRSSAVLFALRRLGGLWRLAGRGGAWFPRPVRDGVYDVVAAVRQRIFSRPVESCPVTPPHLRARFDLDGTDEPSRGPAPPAGGNDPR